jgi:hypothetical protein
MTNIKNIGVMLISFLLLVFSVRAQDIEIKKREIKLHALKIIDTYTFNNDLSKQHEYEVFLKLFEGTGSRILNDVLPANQLSSVVTIDEYYNESKRFYIKNKVHVSIRPYKVYIESDDNAGNLNRGRVFIEFSKYINGVSTNNIRYKDTLDLVLVVRFDYSKDDYYITDIRLKDPDYGKYIVIKVRKTVSKGKEDENLLLMYDEQTKKQMEIDINKKGYFLLKDVRDKDRYSFIPVSRDYFKAVELLFLSSKIGSDDVSQDNHYYLKFKKKSWFMRLAVNGFYGVDDWKLDVNAERENAKRTYYGANGGLQLGKQLFKAGPVRVSILVGGQYTWMSYITELGNFRQSFDTSDVANDPYQRQVRLSGLKETGIVTFIQVPVSLRVGVDVSDKIGLFTSYSYVPTFISEGQYSITADNGSYYGLYKGYYNVLFTEKGIYDFGDYNNIGSGDKNTTNTDDYILSRYELGISFKLNRKTALELSFAYWQSLSNLYKPGGRLSEGPYQLQSINYQVNHNGINTMAIELGLKTYL